LLVNYQAGMLQHSQMLGDRGAADWQASRKLDHRAGSFGDALKNRPPSRVGERSERI